MPSDVDEVEAHTKQLQGEEQLQREGELALWQTGFHEDVDAPSADPNQTLGTPTRPAGTT